MARSDYESLVASKPIAEKIEKFREAAGYPSKSQALSAIVIEVEKYKTVHESLAALVQELVRYIGKLEEGVKGQSGSLQEIKQSIDRILSAITAILSTSAPTSP